MNHLIWLSEAQMRRIEPYFRHCQSNASLIKQARVGGVPCLATCGAPPVFQTLSM